MIELKAFLDLPASCHSLLNKSLLNIYCVKVPLLEVEVDEEMNRFCTFME